jgi:hypothetical protein
LARQLDTVTSTVTNAAKGSLSAGKKFVSRSRAYHDNTIQSTLLQFNQRFPYEQMYTDDGTDKKRLILFIGKEGERITLVTVEPDGLQPWDSVRITSSNKEIQKEIQKFMASADVFPSSVTASGTDLVKFEYSPDADATQHTSLDVIHALREMSGPMPVFPKCGEPDEDNARVCGNFKVTPT